MKSKIMRKVLLFGTYRKKQLNTMTELQFVMQFYNASEYEDAKDQTSQTWESLAKCLEAYKDYLQTLK